VTSRTEEPTPRRLREARRRGEAPRGRELAAAAALLAGLTAVLLGSRDAVTGLARGLRGALEGAAAAHADPVALLRGAAWDVARWSAPACAAALGAGALAAWLQAGIGLSWGALRPRWERLDPIAGLRRLASPASLALAALGLVQAAALVGIACAWLGAEASSLASLPRGNPAALLRASGRVGDLALRLAGAALAFGLAHAAISRWRYRRSLRMTPDEVRRERKDDEGDPLHRAMRRRLHRALLEAGPVARATVVVVNPTHFAVALGHDRAAHGAPVVLAKGAGRDAAAIRRAARRAAVPVVRDAPLARALFRLAEVGEEIPEELYEAAAAVLAHLYGAAAGGGA
jgi:flagellar biosynthesis protein FlhB